MSCAQVRHVPERLLDKISFLRRVEAVERRGTLGVTGAWVPVGDGARVASHAIQEQ